MIIYKIKNKLINKTEESFVVFTIFFLICIGYTYIACESIYNLIFNKNEI